MESFFMYIIDKFGENSDLLCIMFTCNFFKHYFRYRNKIMKVSIITIGLCIFYFTASSASPSPQGDSNNPCNCRFPNSEVCRNRRKEIGCSLTDTKESSITTTTTGKLHFYLLTY